MQPDNPNEPVEVSPTATTSTRRRLIAWIAAGLVGMLAILGAIVVLVVPREHTVTVDWGAGAFSARAVGVELSVEPATYSPEVAAAMADLAPTDYVAFAPLEVSANGQIPASGVTMSLALPAPLPLAASISFAYFDEELGLWVPELTTVSEDRLTISTTVDHLSQWDVFASSVGDFFVEVGEFVSDVQDSVVQAWNDGSAQLFRFSHELLGNSGTMPECTEENPWWVAETMMSDPVMVDYAVPSDSSGIAAVLICAGAHPQDPELLEVKAVANRGYGFPVVIADGLATVGAGPSDMDPTIANVLSRASSMMTDGAGNWSIDPSRFVYATQEYTATFQQNSVRESGLGRILTFELPGIVQVVVSSTVKLALETLGDANEILGGILGVLSMVQDCDLAALEQADVSDSTIWLTNCAATIDADNLADSMDVVAEGAFEFNEPELDRRLKDSAEFVRSGLSKLKWLLIFSVAQTLLDYVGDWQTEEAVSTPAWYVQLALRPPRPTLDSLHGQYGECGYRLAADGIWQSSVPGADCRWGDDFRDQQFVTDTQWNGHCYVISIQSGTEYFPEPQPRPLETWYACPAGLGGPGDDTEDRLAEMNARTGMFVKWVIRE